MIAITFICLKIPNTRTWCMTFALTTALVGSIIVYAAPYHNKGALLAGYYLVRCSLALWKTFWTNKLTLSASKIYAFPTGYILLLAMVFFLWSLFFTFFLFRLMEYAFFFFNLCILSYSNKYLLIIIQIILVEGEDQAVTLESLLQNNHSNRFIEVFDV